MTARPVDSADAAELRDRPDDDELHRATCRRGWLGADQHDRPIACPRCRPHLYAGDCTNCRLSAAQCWSLLDHRGMRCCLACHHPEPPTVANLLARLQPTGARP